MRIFGIIFGLILLAAVPQQANAGTLGCLLGAAAGGLGGAQIGKGRGQLAAVAAGTLLGCGAGSSIQNSDQRRYQRTYQPHYQPQYGQRNYRMNYDQPRWQRRVPYYERAVPYTPSYVITRPDRLPTIIYRPMPQRRVVQNDCPYSREYQAPMITIGGKQVEGYGQACSYDGGQTWALGDLQETQ